MSSLYQYQEKDGVHLDHLSDPASGIRITVNRHGAELISIARRDDTEKWTGFLYRDGQAAPPADGWKNHATVMGYYVHRLLGERSEYRGHVIKGGTHSFLRHKDFSAPAVETDSLTYSINPSEYTPEEYPFKVAMNLTYTLAVTNDEPELIVTFEFHNLEPELSTHVSFGLHPGFGIHSLANAQIILPKGTYIRHLAPGNFLSGETVRIDHPGGPMPFKKEELPGSFILGIDEVPEKIFEVDDVFCHRRIRLDYQEAPYLTIWSDGSDFICVEPCWGLPDHQQQRPFEQKEGLQEIQPGQKLRRTFAIKPDVVG
jgi:galactose mutarotase-like enzyme